MARPRAAPGHYSLGISLHQSRVGLSRRTRRSSRFHHSDSHFRRFTRPWGMTIPFHTTMLLPLPPLSSKSTTHHRRIPRLLALWDALDGKGHQGRPTRSTRPFHTLTLITSCKESRRGRAWPRQTPRILEMRPCSRLTRPSRPPRVRKPASHQYRGRRCRHTNTAALSHHHRRRQGILLARPRGMLRPSPNPSHSPRSHHQMRPPTRPLPTMLVRIMEHHGSRHQNPYGWRR